MAKKKTQKLPFSQSREALKKLQSLQHNEFLNAEDLIHMSRLIDLRKVQLQEFRQKVNCWTPACNYADAWSAYYGTIFEEIDLEIKILDTLYSKFCHVFEESCKKRL